MPNLLGFLNCGTIMVQIYDENWLKTIENEKLQKTKIAVNNSFTAI